MSKRPFVQGVETGDPPSNGVKVPRLDAHHGIGQPTSQDMQQSRQDGSKPAVGSSAAAPAAAAAAGAGGAGTTQAATAPHVAPKSRMLEPPKPPVIHYTNGKPLRDIGQFYRSDRRLVEVVIPSSSMTGNNKQVKARQLWGDHVYTDDSDIVAVLMHLGYYATNNTSNPPQVVEFRALIQLLPPHDHYSSCFRNQVRSRAWFARVDGCSYQVQKCWLATRSGNSVPLAPCAEEGAITAPTFAPSNGDRAMTTRAAAAGSGRPKALAEVTVLYNLCNEPWLKFSMAAVSDRGLKQRQWSSARLRKEVLFLETQTERFQISYSATAPETETAPNAYVLSRCKSALPLPVMRRVGVPLPGDHVEELESGLAWDDFQWGNLSLNVRGREFKVVRVHFMKAVKATDAK